MIEDELLKWKLKRGSIEAMARVYEKYLDSMLTLAMGLLHNADEAQDVVQDVFVSFVRCMGDFRVRGSLRAYLATSVVNRVRDRMRRSRQHARYVDSHQDLRPEPDQPDGTFNIEYTAYLLKLEDGGSPPLAEGRHTGQRDHHVSDRADERDHPFWEIAGLDRQPRA